MYTGVGRSPSKAPSALLVAPPSATPDVKPKSSFVTNTPPSGAFIENIGRLDGVALLVEAMPLTVSQALPSSLNEPSVNSASVTSVTPLVDRAACHRVRSEMRQRAPMLLEPRP